MESLPSAHSGREGGGAHVPLARSYESDWRERNERAIEKGYAHFNSRPFISFEFTGKQEGLAKGK